MALMPQSRPEGTQIRSVSQRPCRFPHWDLEERRLGNLLDDETGIGSRQQLYRVEEMFRRNHGISGELHWTLIRVNRDRNKRPYYFALTGTIHRNLVEHFGFHNTITVITPLAPARFSPKSNAQRHTENSKIGPAITTGK